MTRLIGPPLTPINSVPGPWISGHRGGLNVVPEHTLIGYAASVAAGMTHLEMDISALSDGTGALMHDPTVDRVLTASGSPDQFTAGTWVAQTVDCSAWFSPAWPNTSPATFDEIARRFGGKAYIHPEAKVDARAGRAITSAVVRYRLHESVVVWTFYDVFLRGPGNAIEAGLACGYVSPDGSADPATLPDYQHYMVDQGACSDARMREIIQAGKTLHLYTVDRRVELEHYVNLGVTGIVTNEPTYLAGDGDWRRTTDPFQTGTWYHGQLSGTTDRGAVAGGRLSLGTVGGKNFILQGWAGELAKRAGTYRIAVDATYDAIGTNTTNWFAAWFAAPTDAAYTDAGAASENGYLALLRVSGQMTLYARVNGVATQLATVTGAAIAAGTVVPLQIDVTPTTVTVTRTDVTTNNVVSATDSTNRGGFFHFGRNDAGGAGLRCSVSGVVIT